MEQNVLSPNVDRRVGRKNGAVRHNAQACSVPDCENRSHARGLCTGHWRQWSKGLELTPLKKYHAVRDGLKFCPDCGQTKPVAAFQSKTGATFQSRCASCVGVRMRMKTFGLTRDQVVLMLATGCEVCGDKPDNTRFIHIDHDHVTGRVRGVLCHPCNTALGLLNDNVDRLIALAAYVEHHQS